MKKVLSYLKPYWFIAMWSPIFMMGEVLIDLELPTIMAEIVNEGIINGGGMDVILPLGIKMLIYVILGGIFGVGAAFFASYASQNFGNSLRKAAFSKVMALSIEQTDKFTTGSLVTRMTNDISMVQQFAATALRMFFRSPIFFIGGIMKAIALNAKFGVVIAITIPIQLVVVLFVVFKVRPMFDAVQKKLDKVNSVVQENVTGARVVKAYVREEHENERFDAANKDLSGTMFKIQRLMALMNPVMMIVLNFAVIALIVVGGNQISTVGGILVGDIMAAVTYISQILMSMMMISMLFQSFSRASASAKRIEEVLDAEPVVAEGNISIAENGEKGHIVFENVSFRYPDSPEDSAPVLSNIDLDIKQGENIAVLGATGSGKTTLVNLIPRFYDVTGGKILLDGKDVRDYSFEELRSKVALVLQKSELFSGTVAENLRWGNPDATDEELKKAAEIAQADSFIESFGEGYDTMIAEKGASLSGGQKQRLSIARAILKKPEIIIFDDSMSALDLKTSAKLSSALRAEMADTTVITIAQRVASVMNADRIIVLDGGGISAIGTHKELMENSDVYRDIYNSQLKRGESLE